MKIFTPWAVTATICAILAVTLGGNSLNGGRFSLTGTLLGALIIQTLTYAIYSLGVPPEVNMAVKAVVVFAICLMQSEAFRSKASKLLPAALGRAAR